MGSPNDPTSNISPLNPKFFKIVLQDTIQEQRLAIPKKFVLTYQHCLSNRVILKLPDGKKWEMGLSKSENHEAWLQKGWKEFSDYYSLKLASMLVFEYRDESSFNVFIFDTTLVEIEYPKKKPNFVIPNSEQNPNGFRDAEVGDSDGKCSRTISQSVQAAEKYINSWIKQSLSEFLKMNKIVKDSEVGVSPTVEQSLLEAISAKYGVDKSNSDAEDERTNEEQQDACNKENETASVDCGINAPKIDEKKKRVKVCAGRGKKYRRSFEEDEDFVCDSEEEEDGDDDCTVKSFLFNLKRNVGEIKQESIDEVVRKGAEKVAVKGVKRKVREVVPRTVKTRKRFPVDELGGAKVELVKKEHYKDVDGNCKEGVKERVLNQRISPRMFMESVIPGMPESHKAAIRDIGFGGFLYLDLDTHKSSFARELVMSFDPDRCSLILHKDQEIDVSKEDVHLVYGLPLGGKEIQEFQGTNDDEEFWDFLSKWRALFEIERGSPRNSVVIKEIQRLKKEPLCEAFLLHFVLCAVNCCIRSTNNSDLRFKFLYSCRDVSKISTLDWCGFVYKHLIESAIEWREGSSFFTGPLPFLQICYFDRLQRAKEEKPRKFPLISVWNKEMIRQRMVVETKRGFGKGLVLERIKYEDVVKNEAPQEEGKGLVLERIKYEDVVKN